VAFAFACLALASGSVVSQGPPAAAHGTPDQTSVEDGASSVLLSYALPVGQSFVPSAPQLLTVKIGLFDSGGGDLTVKIRQGSMIGAVLGEISGPTPTGNNVVAHFDFPAPVAVTPGQVYVIELLTSAIMHVFNGATSYPAGNAFLFGAPAGSDLVFQTCAGPATGLCDDMDLDGVPEGTDNCTFAANADQNDNDGDGPGDACDGYDYDGVDSEGDGWTDALEVYLGTDPADGCNADTMANNESPDAWPPDFNDDRTVDIVDVLALKPVFGTVEGEPGYSARFDLNASGTTNITEALALRDSFGDSCA
jgi:hypothetical protein